MTNLFLLIQNLKKSMILHKKETSVMLLLILISCSSSDNTQNKKVLEPIGSDERARQYADKNPITLFSKDGAKSTTFDFSTSNPLWRATLKTLDFLPLVSTDYSGGVINYDWYSDNQSFGEEIKISVRFTSNELRSDSVQVISHKRKCNQNQCQTIKLGENFSREIKDNIITTARLMKIEEEKKKK